MGKIKLNCCDECITKRADCGKTDLQKFIDKYQPSKYKEMKNCIEVRGVYDLNGAINKARGLIKDLGLRLVVVDDAEMAAYKAFAVKEVVS